ncbi:MAG: energy transducer TonB [Anaeromyxobacter sp.]
MLVSLAINAAVLLILFAAGAFDPVEPKKVKQVTLAPLTSAQWEANRAISGAPRPPSTTAPPLLPKELAKVVPPPPPPPEKKQGGQIVQVAPSKDSKKPDSARYLSDRDNSVEKETVSRWQGSQYYENVLPSPSDGVHKKLPPAAEAKGEGGKGAESHEGKEGDVQRGTGADKLQLPKQAVQDKLALERGTNGDRPGEVTVAPKEDRDHVAGAGDQLALPGSAEAGGGAKKQGSMDARLLPDMRTMERIAGGPSMDRIDGVETGDVTALNTRGFKYATYINRMMDPIAKEWQRRAREAYLARDPDGTVYPIQDRTNAVMVELNADGSVASIHFLQRCGLDFLDRTVTDAVNAAGPFPNPPPGLADPDGKIRIAFSTTFMPARPSMRALPPPGWSRQGQQPYPQ